MQTEYELRILNIDSLAVIKKLGSLGAHKVHDEILQRRYLMDFADNRLWKQHAWLRLRTVGDEKVECTLKQRLDNSSIKNAQEIEIHVSDLEKAREIFEFLGLEVKKYQENKRLSYRLGAVHFDIDTQPGAQPYLEIESDTEEAVWSAVNNLGFTKEECIFTAGPEFLEMLGFSMEQQKNIHFSDYENDR